MSEGVKREKREGEGEEERGREGGNLETKDYRRPTKRWLVLFGLGMQRRGLAVMAVYR